MKIKKLLCVLTSVSVLVSGMLTFSISALAADNFKYSDEYKTSQYYTNLMNALDESKDKSTMEKTLAVALSQEGYKNYATAGIDIEQARADGLLWTGAELRMNENQTGNTEYTRWAQRYIMDRPENTQYLDCDWCAIFTSWCMYQAGYYDKEELKRCYYSYYARPVTSYDADGWITTFNLNQKNVWYTPTAQKQLDDKCSYVTYYNTNTDALEIPYKAGGLVFFNWDASGDSFDHVAIVVDYDKDTHILKFLNGNSEGQVITREIDLDLEEEYRGNTLTKNADRIAAYGEYDEIKPLEQREINSEVKRITWDKSATSGIKVQTDSESKVCSVYIDGEYLGSTIESNMVLLEGRMAIGKSEMIKIPAGAHTMSLKFDDGVLDIPLEITDSSEDILVPVTEPVNVTTITLKAAKTKLYAGQTTTVTASVDYPSGETTFSSGNTAVASVSSGGKVTAKKAGTVIITAENNGVKESVKLTVVNKEANTLKVSAKAVTAKSKKTTKITKSKAFKISNPQGALSFIKKSGNKKITINKKSGAITVKKGLKKNKTYKLKVKVNAAGTYKYKPAEKTVTVKVKVK